MNNEINSDEMLKDLEQALSMLSSALDAYYDVTGDILEDLDEGYEELKAKYELE